MLQKRLSGIWLSAASMYFGSVAFFARAGDFVYFDPPYLPVSKTANFAAYHSEAFGLDEHERLLDEFRKFAKRGVDAVLSNSDMDDTRRLYADFSPQKVRVTRAINSNASQRGAVNELLVLNRKRGD